MRPFASAPSRNREARPSGSPRRGPSTRGPVTPLGGASTGASVIVRRGGARVLLGSAEGARRRRGPRGTGRGAAGAAASTRTSPRCASARIARTMPGDERRASSARRASDGGGGGAGGMATAGRDASGDGAGERRRGALRRRRAGAAAAGAAQQPDSMTTGRAQRRGENRPARARRGLRRGVVRRARAP